MTLKRQSVQISDQKTARTFCVSQERANSRTNPMVWSKTNGRALLSGAGGRRRVSETEERSEKYV